MGLCFMSLREKGHTVFSYCLFYIEYRQWFSNWRSAGMQAIISSFHAAWRPHKREEPRGRGGRKISPVYSCLLWQQTRPGRFTFRIQRLFSRGLVFRGRPSDTKDLTAAVALDLLSSQNVCSSRGCHKSESGTACSRETLHSAHMLLLC